VLAYLFWHRPSDSGAVEAYEQALIAFHRSLARSLPVGTRASATFRVPELPWLGGPGGYEDWYLIEDFAALGVLNEAAVGRGHVSSHDQVAHRFGSGTGGLYALIEGEPCAEALGDALTSVWISRPLGQASASKRRDLGELLGDGMAPARASLWSRQMVFGPAPEFCLLAPEAPPGVGAERLPEGWSSQTITRQVLWSG
jgi:hypothetical protein